MVSSSLHKSTKSEFSLFEALNHRNDSFSLAPPWCSSVHCDFSGHSLSPNLSFISRSHTQHYHVFFQQFRVWSKLKIFHFIPGQFLLGWNLLHSLVCFAWESVHCRYFYLCNSIRTGLKEQWITICKFVTRSQSTGNTDIGTTLTFRETYNRSSLKSFWFGGAFGYPEKTTDQRNLKEELFCSEQWTSVACLRQSLVYPELSVLALSLFPLSHHQCWSVVKK